MYKLLLRNAAGLLGFVNLAPNLMNIAEFMNLAHGQLSVTVRHERKIFYLLPLRSCL